MIILIRSLLMLKILRQDHITMTRNDHSDLIRKCRVDFYKIVLNTAESCKIYQIDQEFTRIFIACRVLWFSLSASNGPVRPDLHPP